jgi:hypothetical protein
MMAPKRELLQPGVINHMIVSALLDHQRHSSGGCTVHAWIVPLLHTPKKVVSHDGTCKLNKRYSDIIGYGWDEMWCYATGNAALPGEHSAIVDARAQCTIVADKRFWDFIDRPISMIAMADIWAAKNKKRDIRDAELKRKISTGWTEGEEGLVWKISLKKEYSIGGGGEHHPSHAAKRCCLVQSLASLFIFFFPVLFLERIAQETNR